MSIDGKKKLIDVVVPVYNVRDYLSKTLDSVINQTLDFTSYIKIILVDDGSTDGSDEVCKRYTEAYPDNIIYVRQDNQGVSNARNRGFELATGQYIHFLDSDDILSSNAYTQVLALLEKHSDTIDFATMRLEFFDATLGEHPLNYKFSRGDRVVDIREEPDALVLHSAATIFIRDRLVSRYNSEIKISEDVRFLAEQLCKNTHYGVVQSATYFYRKRTNGLSAITGAESNETYYTITPYEVYEYLFEHMPQTEEGGVNKYAQNMVMYDLQWRLQQSTQSVLTTEQEIEYKRAIYKLIKRIDDTVILHQRNMSYIYKLFALKIKHDTEKQIPEATIEKLRKEMSIAQRSVNLDFIEKLKDSMSIEGYMPDGISSLNDFTIRLGDDLLEHKILDIRRYHRYFLGDLIDKGYVFKAVFSIEKKDKWRQLQILYRGSPLRIVTGRFTRIPDTRNGYAVFDDIIMSHKSTSLVVRRYTALHHIMSEFLWISRIFLALRLQYSAKALRRILKSKLKKEISKKDIIKPFVIPILDLGRNLRDIAIRILYRFSRNKKPIWIISDRFLAAGDNGEALYRYIAGRKDVSSVVYFALSKKSEDYRRLKKEFSGKVIDNGSLRYKLLFLRASKIISSHADDFVINPFSWRLKNFQDIMSFDYVFLQHGVTRNDMSNWLNRYNKNIKLFVTVAQKEYESILNYNYYYSPEKVLLSGFPRFDLLENAPKNKLILAPTWRQKYATGVIDTVGTRLYSESFKTTEYFKFYNNLMNSDRMLSFLKNNKLTGEFYLHPSFKSQIHDFSENKLFTIKDFPYDYKSAFRDGNIMITDYSSVFFDFMYLNKPTIFSQFDRDQIFDIHLYEPGYIDDVKNGFGPVVKTINQVIDNLEMIAQDGYAIREPYLGRVESFFKFHDKDNSRRVYEAILELEAKRYT